MLRSFTVRCLIGALVSIGAASAASAQPGARLSTTDQESAAVGELRGVVRDDRGEPLAGAVVSALGSTTWFAISDRDGRFAFRRLPAGPYLIRVHLSGYVPVRARLIQVNAGARDVSFALLRQSPTGAPRVLEAGVGASDDDADEIDAGTSLPADLHAHDEIAWRLRHLKRSVLKERVAAASGLDDDDGSLVESFEEFGRAVGTPARLASAVFADLPLNGQINFLTAASFSRPQDLLLNLRAPQPIAYVSLEAPMGAGQWRVRGTATQGDLSSWIVAGSYVRDASASHQYEAGLSYGSQRYFGGNLDALAAMREGDRNAGAIYAHDAWKAAPRLTVSYGARYARYDYLDEEDLVSSRAAVTIQPSLRDTLRVRVAVSHRETAPGAEEFIPPAAGVWLPPVRTFSPLSIDGAFRPERLDHVEVAAERRWVGSIVVGVRVFRQRVADQTVTLFGVSGAPERPENTGGHYHVASAGDVDARGWGLSVSRDVGGGVRASVDYTQADTSWRTRGPDAALLAHVAGSVLRTGERVHDVTASVESLVAPTATRVFVLYKLNTAFAAAAGPTGRTGTRFDVQVNQALPFLNFTSAQWEMLVAVSNVVREDLADSALYDELFVIRPPTRVLGGVSVRF